MNGDPVILSVSDVYPVVQRYLSQANLSRTLKAFQKEVGLDDTTSKAKEGLEKRLQALDLTIACQDWINSRERSSQGVVHSSTTKLSQGFDPLSVLQGCLKNGSNESPADQKKQTRKRKGDIVEDESQQGTKSARRTHEVHVGDIPFSADDASIRESFSKCGTITNFHMPRKADGSSNGYCFIAFDSQEAAQEALKNNGMEFQGRKLRINLQGVEKSRNDTETKKVNNPFKIYIGNMPFRIDETAAKKKFSKCGTICKFQMPRKEDGSSNGFCFITYDSEDAVQSALKYNGREYDGRALKVMRAGKEHKLATDSTDATQLLDVPARSSATSSAEVFIGNLPASVGEEAARKKFSKCGTITHFDMPLKPDGKSRRFCFVTYDSEEAVAAALKYNGREYQGRALKACMSSRSVADKKLPPTKAAVPEDA